MKLHLQMIILLKLFLAVPGVCETSSLQVTLLLLMYLIKCQIVLKHNRYRSSSVQGVLSHLMSRFPPGMRRHVAVSPPHHHRELWYLTGQVSGPYRASACPGQCPTRQTQAPVSSALTKCFLWHARQHTTLNHTRCCPVALLRLWSAPRW